jgi:hypothetical protein
MFWARRDFKSADHGPYPDRLVKLMMADVARRRQYIMVSVKRQKVMDNVVYVGVPDSGLLALFDGFERVAEAQLPKEIDVRLVAQGSSVEFTSRFKYRQR